MRICPAYYKASFIKVVGVLWQDPKGTLYTLYTLKLATNLYRILILCSLLVVQLIKTRSKALCTLNKVM